MGDAFQCDACERLFASRDAAVEIYTNPLARALSGKLHFEDGPSVEWPIEDTDVELCAECGFESLEAARKALTDEGDDA